MKIKDLKELWRNLSQIVGHSFAHVRDYLVLSVDDVQNNYDGPLVGQVVVEQKSDEVINLEVSVWTHNDDDSYTKYSKRQDFYGLEHVPGFVESEVDLTRRYEVVFNPSELYKLCCDRNMKIYTDIKDLPAYIRRTLKGMGYTTGCATVNIVATGLYYRVTVCPTGSLSPVMTLLTTVAKGLDYHEDKALRTNHTLNLNIDL